MIQTDPAQNRPRRLTLAISKAKLSEPVRLYLYSLGVLILGALVLLGCITGEWQDYLLAALPIVLGLPPTVWAVRSSVYSYAGHINALRQLRTAQDLSDAIGETA